MEKKSDNGLIMFHPDLLIHDTLHAGQEGGRLGSIVQQLVLDGLWSEQVYEADMAPLKRLRDIHEEEYLNELHRRISAGVVQLDDKTPVMEKSFDLARIGAGEVLDAIDMIMAEEIPSAFCLTAMPSHHAGIKTFCGGSLVNAAAAGAHYLSKKYQMKKIAIIDLDATHGNGTQEIFWKRKDVLFLSVHEYPGFPGSGHYTEVGENPAKGYTVNIPLPSGYGDREYLLCLREIVIPILKQYQPEFLILSFGTNPLKEDPASHLIMTEYGLLEAIRELSALATSLCHGRIISILERGTPGMLMGRAISQHIMLLLNKQLTPVDKGKKTELISYSDWYSYAKVLKAELRKFWKL